MNRLFAIGDIHGCFDSLQELVENQIKYTRNDKFVLLGDYIDTGCVYKDKVGYGKLTAIELYSKELFVVD